MTDFDFQLYMTDDITTEIVVGATPEYLSYFSILIGWIFPIFNVNDNIIDLFDDV